MKKTVAIILARGGSKGIPKKNIKNFCGKPLLVWTIEQCLKSKFINKVIVSSDDKKILNIANKNNAFAIKQPFSISKDNSSSESAWAYVLNYIEKEENFDFIITPQVTSPLRKKNDFDKAIKYFEKEQLDSLFSCNIVNDFFLWEKTNVFWSINYDYKNRKKRQDIKDQYLENGSFYIFKPEVLKKERNRLGGKIGVYEMEFWQSFEIDTIQDFKMCEVLMKGYLI